MSLNPANTLISAGASWPPIYTRGQSNTARLELSGESGDITASACTYTLISPTGTTLATGAATITAGACSFALTSAHLTATAYVGAGYTERWELTLSGTARRQEREVYVGIRDLLPPTQLGDLTSRYATIVNQLPRGTSTWQGHLSEAWAELLRRILRDGFLVFRALTPSALRDPHEHLTLARIFEDLALTQPDNAPHAQAAAKHRALYESSYADMRTALDRSDAGRVDDDATLAPIKPANVQVNTARFNTARWCW